MPMHRADQDRRLPILRGVLPLRRSEVPSEIVAGLTLATLAVPEVMGYTKIAGMPVITGLYTLLLPMLVFAVFGSSRHLVVGADSATAAILAAGLARLATRGSAEYVGLAGVLALLAAAFLVVARVARLGFLADFLSRTVLVGFLTGVGIQVAAGQVAGMLGVANQGHEPLMQLWNEWRQIAQVAPLDVAISAGVIGVVFGARAISRRIPGALLAVVGATVASWLFELDAAGAHLVGSVPSGLPGFGLPHVDLSWPLLQGLVATAFAMFVVILVQSAATSRAYAARYDERFSENTDLVALALANVGAGLSGTFVVNGSPTKTEMVDDAGGRSQLAHLTTVVIVLGVLLLLTQPLAYMPSAALSAIVFGAWEFQGGSRSGNLASCTIPWGSHVKATLGGGFKRPRRPASPAGRPLRPIPERSSPFPAFIVLPCLPRPYSARPASLDIRASAYYAAGGRIVVSTYQVHRR